MKNYASVALITILATLAGCDGGVMGTDGGGVMGTDGGGMMGTDGGGMMGTDGGGGTACPGTIPTVAIRFEGCTPLTPCGGAPSGVYLYEDVCIDADALLPDLSGLCATAGVEDLAGTVEGCVAFDGANVARDVTGMVSATIVVPMSCTFGMGCAPVETALGVTCTVDGTDCRCPYSTTFGNTGTETYTISGNTLTLGDGSTYDFCLMGDALTYQETGAGASEPGVSQLGR